MATKFRIQTFEGNQRLAMFTLRVAGKNQIWDVSAATSIVLVWKSNTFSRSGSNACLSSTPGADWANGIVMAPFGPTDITEYVDTLEGCLVVTIGGQVLTAGDGLFDVLHTPGYVPATPP